ncbi:MAG: hypothetical protein K1060chlam5_00279 [Candidatus Anoxychlamydiales bacterium]|nr:hypothetical protein [Candidatus Anoxychlamydiales bacterium]
MTSIINNLIKARDYGISSTKVLFKIGKQSLETAYKNISSHPEKHPVHVNEDKKTLDQYTIDIKKHTDILVRKTYYVAMIQSMYFAQNWFSISFRKASFVSFEQVVNIIEELEKSRDISFSSFYRLMEKHIPKEQRNFLVQFFYNIHDIFFSAAIFYYLRWKDTENQLDIVINNLVDYVKSLADDKNKSIEITAVTFKQLTKFLALYNQLIEEFNNQLKSDGRIDKLSEKDYLEERNKFILNYFKNNQYLDGRTESEVYSLFSEVITNKFIKEFSIFKSKYLGNKFIKNIILDNMMQCGIENTIESLSNPVFMNSIYQLTSELITDTITDMKKDPKEKSFSSELKSKLKINPKFMKYFNDFGMTLEKTLKYSSCRSYDQFDKTTNSNYHPMITDDQKVLKTAKSELDKRKGKDYTNNLISNGIGWLMEQTGEITLNLIASENLNKYIALTMEQLCNVYTPSLKNGTKEYAEQMEGFKENEEKFHSDVSDVLDILLTENATQSLEKVTGFLTKSDKEQLEIAYKKIKLLKESFLKKCYSITNKDFKISITTLKSELEELFKEIEALKQNQTNPFKVEFDSHLKNLRSKKSLILKKITSLLNQYETYQKIDKKDEKKKSASAKKFEKSFEALSVEITNLSLLIDTINKTPSFKNRFFSYLNPLNYSTFTNKARLGFNAGTIATAGALTFFGYVSPIALLLASISSLGVSSKIKHTYKLINPFLKTYGKPIPIKYVKESLELAKSPSIHHGLIHSLLSIAAQKIK